MNFDTNQFSITGGVMVIPLPREQLNNAHKLVKDIADGKTLSVEIKQKRKRRSTDANAYLWKLLTEIAVKLGSSKDEIYRQMLIRYGSKFHYAVVRESRIPEVEASFNGAIEIIGDVTVTGEDRTTKAKQVLCYVGTSTYDSKEFAIFLDNVIEEAEEIGIECLNKKDRALLIEEWQK